MSALVPAMEPLNKPSGNKLQVVEFFRSGFARDGLFRGSLCIRRGDEPESFPFRSTSEVGGGQICVGGFHRMSQVVRARQESEVLVSSSKRITRGCRHVMKALVLSTLIWLAGGVCFAHEDRTLSIGDDGSINGLPDEYAPAALHVQFSSEMHRAGATRVDSVVLELDADRTVIPICVTGLLETTRLDQIQATASWYHDETVLPYYMNIQFFDPGYDEQRWANAGFSMLFNLRTAKLIKLEVNIVRNEGRAMQSIAVDVSALCPQEQIVDFMDRDVDH